MKKFLTILLLLFATPSFADWDLVATAEDDSVSNYIDLDQIRKEGGFVHFWELMDLKKPDQDGDLSYVTFIMGDCESFQLMNLTMYYYKKNMGEGKSSGRGETTEWVSPEADTLYGFILKKACDL